MFKIYGEKVEDMDKLISVIIPVYNVSKYLRQCVDSVLRQSYKNLEVILVDDGSTDESGMICDRYALNDNRVVVIHKENGGVSDARNVGMSIAKGDYIGFVDSDDYIHYDMYKVLVDLIEQSNADMAIANWCSICDGKENRIDDERTGEIIEFENLESLQFLIYGKNKYKISLSIWDRLYRRELIKDIYFPKDMCYEDVVWPTKVFYKAKKSVYIDRNLYYYRRRSDSIVGTDTSNGISERVLIDEIPQIEEQIRFLKSINQIDMADEVTFNLYQILLSYYTRCYYDKNKLQIRLLKLINQYKIWAKSYLRKCSSFFKKGVLITSLYAFNLLIFIIHINQKREVKR